LGVFSTKDAAAVALQEGLVNHRRGIDDLAALFESAGSIVSSAH
jgi:hypothetical protein